MSQSDIPAFARSGFIKDIPDNVRSLKPAEVVEFQPSNAQLMSALIELHQELASMRAELAEVRGDIGMTKDVIVAVKDQVTPTLEMLQNGPIGQLLGIAPSPPPRKRRGH
jgi:hypothetical protein